MDAGGRRRRLEARRIFATMADAGARVYERSRDLPRLVALWPRELEDDSAEGTGRVLMKLRRALRAERRRAMSGHWSYDLNRHLALLSAYKAEAARLKAATADQRRRTASGRDGR
jgi:hypothetical protein